MSAMTTTPIVKPRLVHAGTSGSKWHLGRTLCNKPASWRTPLSKQLDEVTCVCCRRRLLASQATRPATQPVFATHEAARAALCVDRCACGAVLTHTPNGAARPDPAAFVFWCPGCGASGTPYRLRDRQVEPVKEAP